MLINTLTMKKPITNSANIVTHDLKLLASVKHFEQVLYVTKLFFLDNCECGNLLPCGNSVLHLVEANILKMRKNIFYPVVLIHNDVIS